MNNIFKPLANLCGWSKGYTTISPLDDDRFSHFNDSDSIQSAPSPSMLAKCTSKENRAILTNLASGLVCSTGVVFTNAGASRLICNQMMDGSMHDVVIEPGVAMTVGLVLFVLGAIPPLLGESPANRLAIVKSTLSQAAILSVACTSLYLSVEHQII